MNFFDEVLTAEQRAIAFENMPVEEQRVALEVLKQKNKQRAAAESSSLKPLGRMIQQVVSEPEYFRPGTNEIDYRNPNIPYAQRIAAFSLSKAEKSSQASTSGAKAVKCPYCLDRKYVVINPEWRMCDGFPVVPSDFDPSEYAIGYLPGSSFPGSASERDKKSMVACDCHPGHIGSKDKPVPISRFSDIFGDHISTSVYGERVRAYRQQRAHERERKAV